MSASSAWPGAKHASRYFATAEVWASAATCAKRQVGAVLVKDGHVIATGYNGAPPGLPHCTEVGCFVVDGRCRRTVHAEHNALLQAAKFGISCEGAVMYVTCEPCFDCEMYMRGAGLAGAAWLQDNPDTKGTPPEWAANRAGRSICF